MTVTPMPISSGRTQTSSMSIINSSPLREGILSQEQDFVSLFDKIHLFFFVSQAVHVIT